jgi:transcriptional regulator with XRE-family HTH domain
MSLRIKELRENAGLSQQELAVKADLSLSLVAKLEQGKKADPRVSTVLALTGALGVKPGGLLDGVADLVAAEAEPALADAAAPGKKKTKKKDGAKRKKKA